MDSRERHADELHRDTENGHSDLNEPTPLLEGKANDNDKPHSPRIADGTDALLLQSGSDDDDVDNDDDDGANRSESSGSGIAANKTLYLGNLHPFVTEATLHDVFQGLDGIKELKVIKDKVTGISAGYGFANFTETPFAQLALDKLGRISMYGQEVRINWAFQKTTDGEDEQPTAGVHIFVGDLSSEITDAMLFNTFANCPGCSDARVMWDHNTGRSRGYGFVTFFNDAQARHAIDQLDGQFIGSRKVRCGWAQHKTEDISPVDREIIDRSDPTNTNVYVGNLSPTLPEGDVRNAFAVHGPLEQVKVYRKGSYGFIRYKNHQDAVNAITEMNGKTLAGKVLKCSWGKHPGALSTASAQNSMLLASAGINPLNHSLMATNAGIGMAQLGAHHVHPTHLIGASGLMAIHGGLIPMTAGSGAQNILGAVGLTGGQNDGISMDGRYAQALSFGGGQMYRYPAQ